MAESEINALMVRLGDAIDKATAESPDIAEVIHQLKLRGLDVVMLFETEIICVEASSADFGETSSALTPGGPPIQ